MGFDDLVSRVQDTINVRRVFGEAYEHDGVVVIPVAAVGGGAGGGSGDDAERGKGEGGGFGGGGRPVGAYVIADGRVTWRPAVDVNRVASWASAALIVLVFGVTRVQRARVRAG